MLVKRCPPINQSHKTKSLVLIVCKDLVVNQLKVFLARICEGDVESMVGFDVIELVKDKHR